MKDGDLEKLTSTMMFHVSAAAVLARNLSESLGPSGSLIVMELINDAALEYHSKHEQAFWYTLRDFFDPDINDALSEDPIEYNDDNVVSLDTGHKRKDH